MQSLGRTELNIHQVQPMSASSSSASSCESMFLGSDMYTSHSPENTPDQRGTPNSRKRNTLVPSIQELDRVALSMLPSQNNIELDERKYIWFSLDTAASYFEEDGDPERAYLYTLMAYRMAQRSGNYENIVKDCFNNLIELRQQLLPLYNDPNAGRWWLSFDPRVRAKKTSPPVAHPFWSKLGLQRG